MMIDVLKANPLLLLFVVAAIGYPLGRLRVAGVSLGVAAVLFAGLAIGALDPELKLPEVLYQLGLVLFVYTVGLSSGQLFFAAFRRNLALNAFAVTMLVASVALAALAGSWLGLSPALSVGLWTGSTTNTAALASALEYLKSALSGPALDAALNDPVVGYSITYPMGVIGMIAAIVIAQRLWRIDYAADSRKAASAPAQEIINATLRITNPAAIGQTVESLRSRHGLKVVFGRIRHNGSLAVVTGETLLAADDVLTVVGTPEAIAAAQSLLGQTAEQDLPLDRSELDYRRMFVSNAKIVGIPLRALNLRKTLGVTITRVRRGDAEIIPDGDTRLELGDRVRVIAPRADLPAVSRFFGDSYRALSEVDILTFTLGLVAGLLVGLITVPLPGGLAFKLGFAGGPLVVALILGALDRTGPLVWNLPYSANLTLRQIGLVFFLAGVGTRAGFDFVRLIREGGALPLILAGSGITLTLGLLVLAAGRYLFKLPMGVLTGMLAGVQTQPAVLGFALEQADNDLPNHGYAMVYPIALITKIILAQLMLAWLL